MANINGTSGPDYMADPEGNDVIDGGLGTDSITFTGSSVGVSVDLRVSGPQTIGSLGADTLINFENLVGSAHNDTLQGDNKANRISGLEGNDTNSGWGGDDTFFEVDGLTAQNTLNGGDGNDIFQLDGGHDTTIGGAGTDTIDFSNEFAGPNYFSVSIDLRTTAAQDTTAGTMVIQGVENVIGGYAGDRIWGDNNANVLNGWVGNDILDGGGGDDILIGNTGNDTLIGGDGEDTADYRSPSGLGVTVNLVTHTAVYFGETDTLDGIENVRATDYGDTLTGDGGANKLYALGGADWVDAGAGADTVFDTGGNDTFIGGDGVDTLDYSGAAGGVNVNLTITTAQNTGGAGTDTISGFENLVGGGGDDVLTGGASNDILVGGAGHDELAGGAGADTLDGGADNDSLFSAGAAPFYLSPYSYPISATPPSLLDDGVEVDTLKGGAGSDSFVAGYGDNVDGGTHNSFDSGDTLNLSLSGATSGVTADFRQSTVVIGGGTITGVEIVSSLKGSAFSDNLTAHGVIWGMGGDDRLVAAGIGTAYLYGGDGADILDSRASVGQWADSGVVDGGDGADVIYAAQSTSIDGGAGDDTISYIQSFNAHGGAGADTLTLTGTFAVSNAYGDDGDDKITSGDAADTLYGGAGADILAGGGGNDTLFSADDTGPDLGLERDSLSGGDGNDFITIGYGDHADGGAWDPLESTCRHASLSIL